MTDRSRCSSCGEPVPRQSKVCPHCGSIQPSHLLLFGLIGIGFFVLLFGGLIALFSVGLEQLFGFLIAVVGLAMMFGGYTSYLDRTAGRDR